LAWPGFTHLLDLILELGQHGVERAALKVVERAEAEDLGDAVGAELHLGGKEGAAGDDLGGGGWWGVGAGVPLGRVGGARGWEPALLRAWDGAAQGRPRSSAAAEQAPQGPLSGRPGAAAQGRPLTSDSTKAHSKTEGSPARPSSVLSAMRAAA
jgi:hypothetical protein